MSQQSSKAHNAIKCGIHPLVIASAFDHYARVVMGGCKLPQNGPVYGLLFGGVNNDSSISIRESTDAIYDLDSINFQASFPRMQIEKKIALWTAVFTDYKLIGWYAFGDEVQPEHLRIHKKYISVYAENPIFLLIHKDASADIDRMPMFAYVADSDGSDSGNQIFVEVPFLIQSSQMEKLSMDAIISSVPTDGLSSLEVENNSALSSLRQLDSKLGQIITVLSLFNENKIPKNHDLIRKASKIVKLISKSSMVSSSGNSSSSGASDEEKCDFHRRFEENITEDVMLSFLAAVTKSNNCLSEVTDLYSLVYSDRTGGLGGPKAF